MYRHPAQDVIEGGCVDGADPGQRGHALSQSIVQRVYRRGGRPRSYVVAGESELLCKQVADIAGADDTDRTVQSSCVGHEPETIVGTPGVAGESTRVDRSHSPRHG